MLLLPILLPCAFSVCAAFINNKKLILRLLVATLIGVFACVVFLNLAPAGEINILSAGVLSFALKYDSISNVFALLFSGIFLLAGIYSLWYFRDEGDTKSFYISFMLILGFLIGLSFANTVAAMFLFFVLAALSSTPMVAFDKTEKAINTGKEYVKHSSVGALLALIGLLFVLPRLSSTYFTKGGMFDASQSSSNIFFLIFLLISCLGFSSKAGLFPQYNWLPAAHPVAPSPASAVLSGLITKAGIITLIRLIYFSVGTEVFSGSFVQYVLIILSLITILLGSTLALKEKELKRRLAYSSVSQLSYILCGIFLANEASLQGAMLHVIAHAIIKSGLFLCAGAILNETGIKNVDELKGLGHKMPFTFVCFSLLSFALIGIPPLIGFYSKWYLAVSVGGVLGYIVPIVLIISALLTASYLLPVCIGAFFNKGDNIALKSDKISPVMALPMALLTLLSAFIGFVI
ncbi:MAG: complex I subunit 5 family protein [Christensenellales bacterium]